MNCSEARYRHFCECCNWNTSAVHCHNIHSLLRSGLYLRKILRSLESKLEVVSNGIYWNSTITFLDCGVVFSLYDSVFQQNNIVHNAHPSCGCRPHSSNDRGWYAVLRATERLGLELHHGAYCPNLMRGSSRNATRWCGARPTTRRTRALLRLACWV